MPAVEAIMARRSVYTSIEPFILIHSPVYEEPYTPSPLHSPPRPSLAFFIDASLHSIIIFDVPNPSLEGRLERGLLGGFRELRSRPIDTAGLFIVMMIDRGGRGVVRR